MPLYKDFSDDDKIACGGPAAHLLLPLLYRPPVEGARPPVQHSGGSGPNGLVFGFLLGLGLQNVRSWEAE